LKELIGKLLFRYERVEEETKKKFGLQDLTYKQLECISWIREMKNPNLTELSVKLKITKPSTTALIDKLEEKNYLIKVKSDADRRTAHVHLTKKGENASRIQEEVNKKLAEELSGNLSQEENKKLLKLLNKAVPSNV
jgi:DNA-binding MarR family transcriptional regulator